MKEKLKNIVTAIIIIFSIIIVFWPLEDAKPDEREHVVYWYVAGKKDDIPYAAKKFNESQDSIFLDCVPIPWNEHEKKLLTSVLSESPPDIVMLVSTVPKWAARRALVCLDNAITDDDFDSSVFYQSLWSEMHYKNSVFGIPAYTASYALFYNKKMFREAGLDPENPPKTWNEVKEYSQKLLKREDGKIREIGFIPNYGNLETSFLMALELDVQLKSDDGETASLANDIMVDAFNKELNFYNEISIEEVNTLIGGFGYGSLHGFTSQKVAMMILDNTFIDQIKLYNPDLDYGVAEIPTFEGKSTKSSTGAWWYAIPRGANNKKGAWEFIKFAVGSQLQLDESLLSDQSLFPANVHAANDPKFLNKHFSMKVFDKQMRNTESKVVFPLIHDVFWREFAFARERILHKKQKPYDALLQAEKTIQFNLDRALEYDKYVQTKLPFEQF